MSPLKMKFALWRNRMRRKNGPTLADQCARVIMQTCTLQLDREETRELAPTPGATGPMVISGGAITTVTYHVFDREADRVDTLIRDQPWRAFAKVIMRLSIEKDPEFEVTLESQTLEPRDCHTKPGLTLVTHLSQYFPILAKRHQGPTIIPGTAL